MNHHEPDNSTIYRTCQQNNTMNRTFLDRIKYILGDRKITPWAKSIGLKPTDVTRINSGYVLGSEKLIPITRAENISLSWLLDGMGAPFMVEHSRSDVETTERLSALIKGADEQILILKNQTYPALILSQNTTMKVGKKEITYCAIKIIAGPIGSATYNAINSHHIGRCYQLKLDDFTARKLYAGRLGNVDILGHKEDALFARQTALVVNDEPKYIYKVGDGLPADIDINLLKMAIESMDKAYYYDDSIELSAKQKSGFIAAMYKHMQRTHSTEIDENIILTTLDAIK